MHIRIGGVLLATVLAAGASHAQDAKRGEEAWKLCASCHGFQAEGNRAVDAPALAGREDWYLTRQISNFRHGVRGASEADAPAYRMAQMTGAIKNDADVAGLVAYLGTLRPVQPDATIDGDAAKGRAHYAACASCHGDKAEGNATLNAPALTGIDDWYQVLQLEKFRDGRRGAHPQDTFGQQMVPMASVLPDAAAVRDVVAYVSSLR